MPVFAGCSSPSARPKGLLCRKSLDKQTPSVVCDKMMTGLMQSAQGSDAREAVMFTQEASRVPMASPAKRLRTMPPAAASPAGLPLTSMLLAATHPDARLTIRPD